MAKNTFRRGPWGSKPTVFACRVCERPTRDVGDNGAVDLCPQCFELSGIANAVSDAEKPEEVLASYHSEIAQLFAVLRSKGVKPEALFETLVDEGAK